MLRGRGDLKLHSAHCCQSATVTGTPVPVEKLPLNLRALMAMGDLSYAFASFRTSLVSTSAT